MSDLNEETCGNCRYWKSPSKPAGEKGICRHHPPVVVVSGTVSTRFPETKSDEWCGEHPKLKVASTPRPPQKLTSGPRQSTL